MLPLSCRITAWCVAPGLRPGFFIEAVLILNWPFSSFSRCAVCADAAELSGKSSPVTLFERNCRAVFMAWLRMALLACVGAPVDT